MGGIAGLVCLRNCSDESHTKLVERMYDAQIHRGPDDRGVVTLGRLCLGVTRLRVTELSEAGRQPMHTEDGHLWVALDGTIYNYREIRQELCTRGHSFRTQTDTEVVLHAFQEWGDQCLERFRGMFACVVHDRRTATTLLVRDHFGLKPLHYTWQQQHLFFASEIKGLLAVCAARQPNKRALVEWFLYREVMPPDTLFEDIVSLPPGHMLEVSCEHDAAAPRCYYTPAARVDAVLYAEQAKKSAQQIVEELDGAIDTSVQECLTGDVPVGVMFSGGVDSALIAAMASRYREVTAFHNAVPDDPRMDERHVAQTVADHLHIPLDAYVINAAAFRRELAHATYLNEMPLWHMQCVAFSLLAQHAQARGVKILLSGDSIGALLGAEMGRHRRQQWLVRMQHLLARLPRRLAKALEVGVYTYKEMPITTATFETMIPHALPFVDRFARRGLRLSCAEAYRFVQNPVDRAIHTTKLADLTEWLYRFFHRGDRLGMGASLEYRNPFQDPRSVHMAINLPLRFNICKGTAKWGLKEVATRYMPREIAFRKKVAWDLPAEQYLAPLAKPDLFRHGFCVEVWGLNQPALEHLLQHWQQDFPAFFSLINIEVWGRLFFMSQSVEHVTTLLTGSDEV